MNIFTFLSLQNNACHSVNKIWRYVWEGRHSSVDSSAPTILQSRIQIPSTPSTLLPFIGSQICAMFVIALRKGRK